MRKPSYLKTVWILVNLRMAWIIVILTVGICLLLFVRLFVWGVSGVPQPWTALLASLMMPAGFAIAFGRLCFLAYYTIRKHGWRFGRRALVPVVVLLFVWIVVGGIGFARAVDAGNRRRLENTVAVDSLAAWAGKQLDKYPQAGEILDYTDSGLPVRFVELLQSSGLSHLVVTRPEEVGEEPCIRIAFGTREFIWGLYVGRPGFVPTNSRASCFKWADGVYGWVDTVF